MKFGCAKSESPVRRFLKLEVGSELNPQFIFSSGQRRATGLAFVLSVNLPLDSALEGGGFEPSVSVSNRLSILTRWLIRHAFALWKETRLEPVARSLTAVSLSIAARSASRNPCVLRMWSTAVLVHGKGNRCPSRSGSRRLRRSNGASPRT
jgi:hypothetical protein